MKIDTFAVKINTFFDNRNISRKSKKNDDLDFLEDDIVE